MLCLNTLTKSRNRLTQKKQDCPTVRLRRQSLNRMRFLNPILYLQQTLMMSTLLGFKPLGSTCQHPSPFCSATLTWVPYPLPQLFTFFSSMRLSTLLCRTRKNGQPHCPAQDAAAAKSLQSCPTLCNPIDGSPPGSPVPGIL